MIDDRQLLDRYATESSDEAFRELVRRHVGLIYSAALRQVRDPHWAQDVTQMVFANLARKARSIPTGTLLAGWLHRDTRFTALDLLRAEARRSKREQQAAAMNILASESPPDWERIRPLLDEALDEIGPADRDALLLRFFEESNFATIGVALGISADAARKRVDRGLDRLREYLVKRGITTTSVALSGALSAHAIEAIPSGFAGSLVASSVVAAAIPKTASWFSFMILTNTKYVAGAVLIAASLATALMFQQQAIAKARAEQAALLPLLPGIVGDGQSAAQSTETDRNAQRDREELERLRRDTVGLRARISELAASANVLNANPAQNAGSIPIGKTLRLAEMQDAGQATPSALLQTQLWAMLRGDTNRLAQLWDFNPETDMLIVQRRFEELQKEVDKKGGMDGFLRAQSFTEIRLLEEQPAQNNDRWVVHEFVNKDGEIKGKSRIRVRLSDAGWKVVIGIDGQPEEESIGEQP